MQKTYRTIFVSDVHLGTKDCKAEQLNNFLKHNTCETLYLVGDRTRHLQFSISQVHQLGFLERIFGRSVPGEARRW